MATRPHWQDKLKPLRMLTLAETREASLYSRADVAVTLRENEKCWAEIEERHEFRGCANDRRDGYLTCLVHYTRELAARELKCEADGVVMASIAYETLQDEAEHIELRRRQAREYLVARQAEERARLEREREERKAKVAARARRPSS